MSIHPYIRNDVQVEEVPAVLWNIPCSDTYQILAKWAPPKTLIPPQKSVRTHKKATAQCRAVSMVLGIRDMSLILMGPKFKINIRKN